MVATLDPVSTSKFVQAGSVRIHYNEAGSGGPPIICLHGGGPGATGWSNFHQNLPAFASRYRTLLVDLPQFGQSEPVVISEPRLSYNARVMRDMLDALGIEQATFVGNSMGGGTSAKFAIDYPERIHRLVLMGAAGHGESLFAPSPTEGIKFLQDYYKGPSKEKMRKVIEAMVFDPSFLSDKLLEERYQASIDPAILEAREKSSQGLNDLTTELRKIKAKTLVLWGRDDRVVPLDHALSFGRRIPDATLVIFPRCGHWVQVEHAEEFTRLVLDFLAH